MHTLLKEVKKEMNPRQLLAIHEQTVTAAKELKSCEVNLIKQLQEVDQFLVHRFVGYNSLYQYAPNALKLRNIRRLCIFLLQENQLSCQYYKMPSFSVNSAFLKLDVLSLS